MTRTLRTFTALFLALILGLTSHSLAMARTMPGPSGQVELCTGTGPVTIYVDEDGQPVGRAHFCPDCALHLLGGVIPPDVDLQRIASCTGLHICCLSHSAASAPQITAAARGPPLPV